MRNFRKEPPSVNAGSMADIAFLLLIFFLVTTTIENDVGIPRKLPRPCLTPDCIVDIPERNVFRIVIGKDNDLLVEDQVLSVVDLKAAATAFIDNNLKGGCLYCGGAQLENASDNPKVAVISVKNHREASYDFYIEVQNELVGAYFDLRKKFALKKFNKELSALDDAQLTKVREAYPLFISEAEVQ